MTKLDFQCNSAKIYLDIREKVGLEKVGLGERSMKFTSSHKDCSLLLILF